MTTDRVIPDFSDVPPPSPPNYSASLWHSNVREDSLGDDESPIRRTLCLQRRDRGFYAMWEPVCVRPMDHTGPHEPLAGNSAFEPERWE